MPIDNERETIEDKHCELEREELINEIEEIINKALTPTQQLIIKEKEYKDKSIEEIASMLNMQPTAVRMQLSRARKRIREIYKEREP